VARTEVLYAKCDPGLKDGLRFAAGSTGVSDSEFIRRAVAAAISHVQDVLSGNALDSDLDLDAKLSTLNPTLEPRHG
jgi:hypothetical protein